jgi:hypothetical protein
MDVLTERIQGGGDAENDASRRQSPHARALSVMLPAGLAGGDVHGDFEAETEIAGLRGFPVH